jgi:hypothetical protein
MSFSTKKCLLRHLLKHSAVTVFLILLSFSSCRAKTSDFSSIAFFPGEGLKGYNGSSWSDFSEGLPKDIIPENITSDSKGTLYLGTEYSGLFKRSVTDDKWTNIATQDLRRRTQLQGVSEYRKISSFCVNPTNDSIIYAGTKHALYMSSDAGKTWQHVLISNNKNSYYFTSITVAQGILYAGTAFNGIVKIVNGRAEEINNGIPKEYYVGKDHFCEEVSALAFRDGTLYSGYLFAKGMYESKGALWKQSLALKDSFTEGIHCIAPYNNALLITTDDAIYEYTPSDGKTVVSPINAETRKSVAGKNPTLLFLLKTQSRPALLVKNTAVKYTVEKKTKAGEKHALYVSWSMIDKNFSRFLDIAVRNKFNAVIIDVKDDYGVINAPIQSKTASEIGAVRNTNIKEIVKSLKAKGIWTIARNVTFKDKKLYEAYNGKYAILDRSTNQPWVGLPRERWCDPYSKFVRDYNIEIAKETVKLGFDEIQFDYIRFPTDGPTGRCYFRYKENTDTFKSEILADFLQQAKQETGVPISVDIYGFNGWYHFGNNIGQDLEYLSRFVDVICPMIYPSHFGASFYQRYSKEERPYWIVRDSTIRSIYLSRNRAVIRPWIQDFNYLSPTWGTEYILKQMKGIADSGGNSYSFWNPAGDHSMADRALQGK